MKQVQPNKKAAKPQTPRTLQAKAPAVADPARNRRILQYESAMRLLREGKYEKAKTALQALLETDAGDLQDRIRVHLAASQRQLEKQKISFDSPEEQYDYAISLLNTGYYEDARENLEAILKNNRSADYAHYGMAVLYSLTGRAEQCLEQLGEAIELNPQNRTQARMDSDFQEMTDDPRFTELLYPDVS